MMSRRLLLEEMAVVFKGQPTLRGGIACLFEGAELRPQNPSAAYRLTAAWLSASTLRVTVTQPRPRAAPLCPHQQRKAQALAAKACAHLEVMDPENSHRPSRFRRPQRPLSCCHLRPSGEARSSTFLCCHCGRFHVATVSTPEALSLSEGAPIVGR